LKAKEAPFTEDVTTVGDELTSAFERTPVLSRKTLPALARTARAARTKTTRSPRGDEGMGRPKLARLETSRRAIGRVKKAV